MLKSQNRLKNKIAFSATYKQHQIYSDDLLILHVGKKKEYDEHVKIGFVVSKKISKLATTRNQIKRYMREALRLYLKENDEPSVKSLIFGVREKAIEADFKTVQKSALSLLSKVNRRFKSL